VVALLLLLLLLLLSHHDLPGCSSTSPPTMTFRHALARILYRPNTPSRIATAPVDGMRALAFMWIFGLHVVSTVFVHSPRHRLQEFFEQGYLVEAIWNKGHFAVDIFHLLSAFLATRALLRAHSASKSVSPMRTVTRRMLRIVPFYYFFLVLASCVHLAEPLPGIQSVWANFVFINNTLSMSDQFMQHTWTQAVEVQFSLILPFLLKSMLWYRDHHAAKTSKAAGDSMFWRILGALIVVFVGIRFAAVFYAVYYSDTGLHVPMQLHTIDFRQQRMPASADTFYTVVYLPIWCRMTSFLFGIGVAFKLHCEQQCPSAKNAKNTKKRKFSLLYVLIALVCVMVANWAPTTSHEIDWQYSNMFVVLLLGSSRLLFGAGAAYFMWMCLSARLSDTVSELPMIARAIDVFLGLRVWYPIATVSYAGYLFHVLVLGGVEAGLANDGILDLPRVILISALAFGATLIFAAIVHIGVEHPLLRWRASQLQVSHKSTKSS
jgi:peptidoglycan/LPS O-acetylase OafA/YrhL